MRKGVIATGVGFCLVFLPLYVQAATVYVDKSFAPCDQSDGSLQAPYCTIQEAIGDFNSDEIIVYPGIYTENILITKNLVLRGYDGPHTTAIDGSTHAPRPDTVTLNQNISVVIEGLKISSGRYGVYVPKGTSLRLRNCVICSNDSDGLRIDHTDESKIPSVIVYNCIFVANVGSGVYIGAVYVSGYYYPAYFRMRNSILIGNTEYGVNIPPLGNTNYAAAERITLDYNDCVSNVAGAYYPNAFCSGRAYSCGPHSISVPPEFVSGAGTVCNKDFRLKDISPCKDAGDPGMGWIDPDGTQNDMGAYGGPGAQSFYTNPNDGPIVREVILPQGMVPKGETFEIRARGAVR